MQWDQATEGQTAVLVRWLRSADNPQRNRRVDSPAQPGAVNVATGKPLLPQGYSAATINLTLAAVRGFYEFHAHWGRGPVTNPVPESPQRRRALAHRSPLERHVVHRRGPYRSRSGSVVQRSISDQQWDALFGMLTCDRDRALFACFVATGARANELLAATFEDLDWAGQRLWVVSKGTRARRLVPLSPEAMLWLARYLEGASTRTGPLWVTRRGARRTLSYGAARRVLQRVNDQLGTNWTLHDVRHTAASRMAGSGTLTLPEVQVILGHADLRTTSRYTRPRVEELCAKLQEFYTRPPVPAAASSWYPSDDAAVVFGARVGL